MNLELFETLKNSSLKKRIINELTKIDTNSTSLDIFVEMADKKLIIKVTDKLYKTNNIYSFVIGEEYPFGPPKVFINDKPYINFLKIKNVVTSEKLKLIKGYDCFCCESLVVCGNKWRPQKNLIDVVEEIRKFRQDSKDIIYKMMIDKIKKKYLKTSIEIDSWLF